MRERKDKASVEGAIGQVKFFKPSEGYGFIRVFKPENIDDVYVHISDYKASTIHKDDWMEFDIKRTNKGRKAVDLRKVSQPPEHELFGTSFVY